MQVYAKCSTNMDQYNITGVMSFHILHYVFLSTFTQELFNYNMQQMNYYIWVKSSYQHCLFRVIII